jgi:putative oxygen-independent coproporphyrinogen III oxidase
MSHTVLGTLHNNMLHFSHTPPLSLYIHMPWCVSKCPYCDFNSHVLHHPIPEQHYLQALLSDFDTHMPLINERPILSIFIGGGTPSLISPNMIADLLDALQQRATFAHDIEITMEANPNSIDRKNFADFYKAGINRLSIGIQSFANEQLKNLGRAHDHDDAITAIHIARDAGFHNINLDIMHGLPSQSLESAMSDLEQALTFNTNHLSWYQLTLEPNTPFYHQPPTLPTDDTMAEIQNAGQALLQQAGYQHYEVSAFCKPGKHCQHNINYWQFGDYIGIGAGAHSKLTNLASQSVHRYETIKYPNLYMQAKNRIANTSTLSTQDLIFEFMLNHLRLNEKIPLQRFTQHTGLPPDTLRRSLEQATKQNLLSYDEKFITPTPLGRRFLNDLIEIFLVTIHHIAENPL